MRQLALKTLESAEQGSNGLTSATQDMTLVEGFSVQVNLSSGLSADFDLAIQGSNNDNDWVDIATDSISGTTASKLLIETSVPYLYMRVKADNAAAGEQDITCVADVASSLNDTYFLLNSPNGGVEYYVWFNVDSAGTDPMIADKTGVEVAISEDDDADTVAAAVDAAIDALSEFTSSATNAVVSVTNAAAGNFLPASDSVDAPTGFNFEVTASDGLLTVIYNAFGEKATQD